MILVLVLSGVKENCVSQKGDGVGRWRSNDTVVESHGPCEQWRGGTKKSTTLESLLCPTRRSQHHTLPPSTDDPAFPARIASCAGPRRPCPNALRDFSEPAVGDQAKLLGAEFAVVLQLVLEHAERRQDGRRTPPGSGRRGARRSHRAPPAHWSSNSPCFLHSPAQAMDRQTSAANNATVRSG